MILSSSIDPAAFNAELFASTSYKLQAEMYLKGVLSNGIIIVDPEGRIKQELITFIQLLPSTVGQQVKILIEEIMKHQKKKIIACLPDSYTAKKSQKMIDLLLHIKQMCKVDYVITTDETIDKLKADLKHDKAILSLTVYSNSHFENERRRFIEGILPIDMLSVMEIADVVSRSIKFSKWLRIYDKQIGTGDRTYYFKKGIKYILNLWKKDGYFVHLPEVMIEIFTCAKEKIRIDDGVYDSDRKMKLNNEAINKIRSELVSTLKQEYGLKVTLYVKDDQNAIFHARHLESQYAILLFDRGFDLFNSDGKFNRNIIKVDTISYSHVKECRLLKDVDVIN
jgi:hypothetical protein